MATIETLQLAIKKIVLEKLKIFGKGIKKEIVSQAREQGHYLKTTDVKSVKFEKLDLTNEVTDFQVGKMNFDEDELKIVVHSREYENNSDATNKASFSYEEYRKDTWAWKITEGVAFDYSAHVEIPELARIGRSVKVNFAALYGETHEHGKQWRWSAIPQITPHSKMMIHAILKQVAGTIPISCTVIADGKAWCNVEIDYWGKHIRKIVIPLARLLSIRERTFSSTGEIRGASGYSSRVQKNQLPLTDKEKQELPEGMNTRELKHLSFETLELKV